MSTVILDTITGKSTATTITIGSTPVVSASANSMTIRGEGSAQTSIQQGLAKAWLTMDGVGTIAIVDSFNIGGITDVGTGDYSCTYSSNLGTGEHPIAGSVIGSGENNYFSFVTSTGAASATTGDGFQLMHVSAGSTDQDPVHIIVHGDLA
jgi:hypothetical protein